MQTGRYRRAGWWIGVAGAIAVAVLAFGSSGTDVSAHKRAPKVASRPSIVVILTDDQPSQTLWAMPRTQRLLSAHGVKFTAFYDSVALCCPARAALLTGRYAHSTSRVRERPAGGRRRHVPAPSRRSPDPGGVAPPRGLSNRPLREVPERLQGRVRPAGVGHLHHLGALLGRAGIRAGRHQELPASRRTCRTSWATRTAQFIRSVHGRSRSSRTTPRTPRTATRAPSPATHPCTCAGTATAGRPRTSTSGA